MGEGGAFEVEGGAGALGRQERTRRAREAEVLMAGECAMARHPRGVTRYGSFTPMRRPLAQDRRKLALDNTWL